MCRIHPEFSAPDSASISRSLRRSEVLFFHEQPVLFEERSDPCFEVRQPCDRVGRNRAVGSFVIELSAIEVITIRSSSSSSLCADTPGDWRELPTFSASGVSLISIAASEEAPITINDPTIQLGSSGCVASLVSC